MYETLKECYPQNHARQVNALYHMKTLLQKQPNGSRVLDLGCGPGNTVDSCRRIDPEVRWHGLDIKDSGAVRKRKRTDADFFTYDGIHVPFKCRTFDVVLSVQVFEHVRYPEKLLAEIRRILKPRGYFTGSVSALEPYHSESFWSYTPYGWHVLLTSAGLKPLEFRPGIDGVSLIKRSIFGGEETNNWFKKSPINEIFDQMAENRKLPPRVLNHIKVQYCGHLIFLAQRHD